MTGRRRDSDARLLARALVNVLEADYDYCRGDRFLPDALGLEWAADEAKLAELLDGLGETPSCLYCGNRLEIRSMASRRYCDRQCQLDAYDDLRRERAS